MEEKAATGVDRILVSCSSEMKRVLGGDAAIRSVDISNLDVDVEVGASTYPSRRWLRVMEHVSHVIRPVEG